MIDEDALVEAMARAMCLDGDPDTIIHRVNYINGEPQKEVENLPRWKAYEDDARRQLAAHRAMMDAILNKHYAEQADLLQKAMIKAEKEQP
jgi:hypothetical protein